jgi:hypothetical protein
VVKNGKFVSFAKLDDLAAFAPPDK